jgi:hypothetical protein
MNTPNTPKNTSVMGIVAPKPANKGRIALSIQETKGP